MIYLRLLYESFRFSWAALTHNPLRTILSLAGVTIGIFLIIAVLTVVNSLERNIRDSFNFLGAETIYVQKWPWLNSPNYPWWKFFKRPQPVYSEYEYLKDNLQNQTGITIFAIRGNNTIKRGSNSIGGINIYGTSGGHLDVFELDIDAGRFFSMQEFEKGQNVAVIGKNTSEALFKDENPLGKIIKLQGNKYSVIGVLQEEGETMLSTPSNDENVLIPFKSMRKLFYVGKYRGVGAIIVIKGLEDDIGLINLEYETKGMLRSVRGLKPYEEDDFALNKPEMIANEIGKVFDVLTLAGAIIGGFSILVGAFGIANIMFVSVNERIGIIGIQKSLGAKNYFILFQFLFEAIFLSLIGGFVGLLLVGGLTMIPMGSFVVNMVWKNVILGVSISMVVGILSGIVPAAMAARLDPVEAIRAN